MLCTAVLAASGQGPRIGYPALDVFRLQATSVVLPTYPPSSIAKKHSGTAVAEVSVSPTGTVAEVRILETPDAEIGKSVSEAVARWSFRPLVTADNVSHPMKGRLIFYFKINKNKPIVIDVIAQKLAASGAKVPP